MGIRISNFKTYPLTVHVGDSFTIGAIITNDSPNAITYTGDCFPPLSATFNKNVHTSIERNVGICNSGSRSTLNPGEKAKVNGPLTLTIYTASGTGPTKAKVTFEYSDAQGNIEKSVSKSFTFTILK